MNQGANIRTGVTAILPHPGNLFREKVPGAVFIGNAFGKLVGSTQVNELGEIETPILLTSTLNVFRVADELINYMFSLDGNSQVRSINPVVGETNDGVLNDIQGRHVGHNEVFAALQSAKSARSRKARWARAREPSRSVGRAASEHRRAKWANTPSACWCRRISADA